MIQNDNNSEHRIIETNNKRKSRFAGQESIFFCALLWSTSGLFIRLLDWHPMVISGGRSALAVVFLLAIRFFPLRQKNNFKEKIERAKIILRETPKLAACGLCYAATMILFVIANKLTAPANAILLQYAAPVWAALFGWFFLRERPHWEQWCALVLVCFGMYIVFSSGLAAGSVLGDITAVLSGIAFGANSVVLRKRKDGNPADILIFSHITCVIFSIPFYIIYPPSITVNNLLCIGFMGIFQIGMASALFAYGIKRVPAVQAMLTASIEPVLNPVWVLIVTGERPGLSVITGGAIILAAVIFSSALSALRGKKDSWTD